jgi:hypothetical protein
MQPDWRKPDRRINRNFQKATLCVAFFMACWALIVGLVLVFNRRVRLSIVMVTLWVGETQRALGLVSS